MLCQDRLGTKRTQRGKVATPHQLQDHRSNAARQQRGPAARLQHTLSLFEFSLRVPRACLGKMMAFSIHKLERDWF